MDIQIRDARAEELATLSALCRRSKASWGYDADFMRKCETQLTLTPGRLEQWRVRVADRAGVPVGVSAFGLDPGAPTQAEIELLFVEPEAHRQGIGRRLLRDMQQSLAARHVSALWILSDPGAAAFYRRCDAVHVAMRPSDCIVGRHLPWLRLAVNPKLTTLRTPRLLLRAWRNADRVLFAELNRDPEVIKYLHPPLSSQESDALVDRIGRAFETYGFGLWAVERLDEPAPFIGFVGLAVPSFEAAFTPCTEIGWRLSAAHWGQGLATEAAREVIRHAFEELKLEQLVSFTAVKNRASQRVMQKLGMTRDPSEDFRHPKLEANDPLNAHVLYRLHCLEPSGASGAGFQEA